MGSEPEQARVLEEPLGHRLRKHLKGLSELALLRHGEVTVLLELREARHHQGIGEESEAGGGPSPPPSESIPALRERAAQLRDPDAEVLRQLCRLPEGYAQPTPQRHGP